MIKIAVGLGLALYRSKKRIAVQPLHYETCGSHLKGFLLEWIQWCCFRITFYTVGFIQKLNTNRIGNRFSSIQMAKPFSITSIQDVECSLMPLSSNTCMYKKIYEYFDTCTYRYFNDSSHLRWSLFCKIRISLKFQKSGKHQKHLLFFSRIRLQIQIQI